MDEAHAFLYEGQPDIPVNQTVPEYRAARGVGQGTIGWLDWATLTKHQRKLVKRVLRQQRKEH